MMAVSNLISAAVFNTWLLYGGGYQVKRRVNMAIVREIKKQMSRKEITAPVKKDDLVTV